MKNTNTEKQPKELIIALIDYLHEYGSKEFKTLGTSIVSDFKNADGLWQSCVSVGGYTFKTRSFSIWDNMKNRCTKGNSIQRNNHTYIGCTMCEEWYSYDAFMEWAIRQPEFYFKDYELDKDLLATGKKKQYSPDTCCFIPAEINVFLTSKSRSKNRDLPVGVSRVGIRFRASCAGKNLGTFDSAKAAYAAYRKCKQASAKALAEKYKGLISERAYDALLKFKIPRYVAPKTQSAS